MISSPAISDTPQLLRVYHTCTWCHHVYIASGEQEPGQFVNPVLCFMIYGWCLSTVWLQTKHTEHHVSHSMLYTWERCACFQHRRDMHGHWGLYVFRLGQQYTSYKTLLKSNLLEAPSSNRYKFSTRLIQQSPSLATFKWQVTRSSSIHCHMTLR